MKYGAPGTTKQVEERTVRCDVCTRLLGTFVVATGTIKCPRCKHVNTINIGAEGDYRHRAA